MTNPAEQAPLVVIGAGGTGGHMFPAAAFAEEMRARGWRVGLISDVRGLRYAAKFPADWKEQVDAASPNLRKPWTLPATALKLNKGVGQAASLLKTHSANLVVGFGGYPAFPALSAAKRLKLPMMIHEQNAVLGRVNRNFAKAAREIVGGFARLDRLPAGRTHLPIGNPVRSPIAAKRETPYPDTSQTLRIFVTGGSQGARILGETLPLALANHLPESLRARLKIVQQVREEQLASVSDIYDKAGLDAELKTFFDDMPDQLAAAHLVIARSGAGTVSEIAAIGRPSVLIPLKIAMDDHQTANAAALVDVGAADLVDEDNFSPEKMGDLIRTRLENGDELRTRAAAAKAVGTISAASDLADLAEQVANHRQSEED